MKKINLINRIYIAVALCLVATIVVKTFRYKSWDRFRYVADVCTPATYPVYIHHIDFLLPDGEHHGGFYKSVSENVNNFSSRWAETYMTGDSYEPEFLPVSLVLNYTSYRNQKVYTDTLRLPQEKMREVFKSARKNKQMEKLYGSGEQILGLTFLVGIANDGNVVVWLRGIFLDKVIMKAKLMGTEPGLKEFKLGKVSSKAAYINSIFKDMPDSLRRELDRGLDAKASYIDSPGRYIEQNKELWEYQKKNHFID